MTPTLRKQNTPPRTDEDTLRTHIERTPAAVAAALGQWKLLQLSQMGEELVLQAMINGKEQAILTMARKKDGTISVQSRGEQDENHTLYADADELVRPIRVWAGSKALEEVISQGGPHILPDAISRMEKHYETRDMDIAVSAAIDAVTEPATLPRTFSQKTAEKIGLGNLPSSFNSLVRRTMVDKDAARLAIKLFQPDELPENIGACASRHYNTVIMNLDTFRTMSESSPNVLGYFCRNIAFTQDPRKVSGPGEIVENVRTMTKLSGNPAGWRYFCRLWTLEMEREAKQKGENVITPLTAADLAIQINRPAAPDTALRHVILMEHHHRRYRTAQWEQGDTWKAWTNVLNQFLGAWDRQQPPSVRELNRVQDALNGHIQDNEPWGPGNWENLTARAERWHNLIQERRTTEEKSGDSCSWESLVEHTEYGRVTIRAVTNGRDLRKLGDSMGNCLRTYWQHCFEGRSRIFVIVEDGRTAAAAELRNTNGRWSTGQIEAPFRGKLRAAIMAAVEALRSMYQKAHDEREENGDGPSAQ